MSAGSLDAAAARERLSAMLDGQGDSTASAAACATWRSDAEARRNWHAWHVIGDVLRSEDLASDATRDLRLVAAVRARLATEPVVLAPAGSVSAPPASPGGAVARRSGRWLVPSAVAAGFMLVVGTFAVLRPGGPAGTGAAPATLAVADTRKPVVTPVRADSSSLPPAAPASVRAAADTQPVVVADGKLVCDERLDRYLVAHKQFAGTSALGVPSTFLRSATVDSVPR